MTLSVIIPSLNEEEALPRLLRDLSEQQGIELEIIVADGGSTDRTVALATASGAVCLSTGRGRAVQMNAGARGAAGEFLLFLHADSGLNDPQQLAESVARVKTAIDRSGHCRVAGHFSLRFIRSKPGPSLAYRFLEEKTRLNRPHTTSGDQGFLLHRDFFFLLGGFDESLPFLEDQRLAERIRREGHWITLEGRLSTSARRFEMEGFGRRYLLMAIMMVFFRLGRWDFFDRARGVYRVQTKTRRLRLSPFLDIVLSITRGMPMGDRFRFWLSVGEFARDNLWQMFLFLDVIVKGGAHSAALSALRGYDLCLAGPLRMRIFGVLAMMLVWLWFHVCLRPYYRIRDRFPEVYNPDGPV